MCKFTIHGKSIRLHWSAGLVLAPLWWPSVVISSGLIDFRGHINGSICYQLQRKFNQTALECWPGVGPAVVAKHGHLQWFDELRGHMNGSIVTRGGSIQTFP